MVGRVEFFQRPGVYGGISMGLEVSYKAFVGNYARFLEPIHPLPDLNVDVAA